MIRYAAKVDTVQPACVKLWRRFNKEWIPTHRQGDGVPDGFLLHMGVWLAIEFKTGKRKLNEVQKELHERVSDKGGRIFVVRSEAEAALLIGIRLAA